MAQTLRDRLRELDDEKNRWFRERNAQAAQAARALENAGRDAWNAATRAGVDLVARTPEELRALGERAMAVKRQSVKQDWPPPGDTGRKSSSGRAQNSVALPYKQQSSVGLGSAGREAALQADTAVRSAANLLTFGGADHLAAAGDAVLDWNSPYGFQQRYQFNLANERARNQYDAIHRPTAQVVGKIGGTVLSFGGLGAAKALAVAPRLPGAASLTMREGAALLGAGATSGAGAQAVGDAAGGRRSTAPDLAGATVGGALGAAALPLGPARAGAVEGWATSTAQDLFNGRPISLERAEEGLILGRAIGGLAGRVGHDAANGLSPKAKGKLGQAMGEARSAVNGQPRDWTPKARDYVTDKTYWYPDGRSGATRFEDKFGYGADLSDNQKIAQAVLGPDFKLYHFTPEDIGHLAGLPGSAAASQLDLRPAARRRGPPGLWAF